MEAEMYRVAVLERPNDDAEFFDEIEDAEERAINESVDDSVYGVWENESGELVSIVYQQRVFSS